VPSNYNAVAIDHDRLAPTEILYRPRYLLNRQVADLACVPCIGLRFVDWPKLNFHLGPEILGNLRLFARDLPVVPEAESVEIRPAPPPLGLRRFADAPGLAPRWPTLALCGPTWRYTGVGGGYIPCCSRRVLALWHSLQRVR
jgi:hypothetical protein